MLSKLVDILSSEKDSEAFILRELVAHLAEDSNSTKVKNAAKKLHADLCGKESPYFAKLNGQFYTKPQVAEQCFESLNLDNHDLIIEPSAGRGDFLKLFPSEKEVFALDIDPKCEGVEKMSFFDYTPPTGFNKIAVVGNPPFGKNAGLAVNFIKHAAKFADTIAFILPRTFRKTGIVNKIPRNFWLQQESELPEDSFYIETKSGTEDFGVRCVFQVWKRKSELRDVIVEEKEHDDFEFVNKDDDHDFAVRRAGNRAGEVFEDTTDVVVEGNYFIRSKHKRTVDIFSIAWSEELDPSVDRNKAGFKYDSAGQATISKAEIVSIYKKYKVLDK